MTARCNKIEFIIIDRHYKHSPERVFEAFSRKAAFEQWIAPSDEIGTRVLLHDFKIGGQYRIEFSIPDSGKLFLKGEYVHIEQPRQICFTWEWEEPDVHAGINSLVTVDFLEHKGNTRLTITHENLSTLQATERHIQGWNGALLRLEKLITNQPDIQG